MYSTVYALYSSSPLLVIFLPPYKLATTQIFPGEITTTTTTSPPLYSTNAAASTTMNIMRKTLFRTCKSTIFLPSIPIHLNPFSVSSPYSTNFPSFEPTFQPLSPMDDGIDNKKLKRPSEIPFQSKVANWVNFVGTVRTPIQFCTSVDGKSWAATVIAQRQHSSALPSLRISVVFEGYLAETAAVHLKENHYIYVGGHLSSDSLPINLTNDQVKLQVMVHDFYFVRFRDHSQKVDMLD